MFGYDCGSLGEVIGDGGAVVPEGDAEALSREVSGFLGENFPTRTSLGKSARESGARFAEDALAEHLVQLWRGVDGYPEPSVPSVAINFPAGAEPDRSSQSAI